ncbi:hypothetical protein BDR22DRAFT_816788 [Usnea florida]
MAHEVSHLGTVHRKKFFDVIRELYGRLSPAAICQNFQVQRNALLTTFTAMCQTFYEKHEKCTCIFVQAEFTPCAAYSQAHPEVLIEGPDPFAVTKRHSTDVDSFADPQDTFADPVSETNLVGKAASPKLLTKRCRGLDLACHGIDFVSIDINDLRAPKGLLCSEIITSRLVDRREGEIVACRLCDRPDVLEKAESIVKWHQEESRKKREKREGKRKEEGNEKGKGFLRKTGKLGTAAIRSLKGAVSERLKKMKNDSTAHQ